MNSKIIYIFSFLALLATLPGASPIYGQASNEYSQANRLLEQQQYEEAYRIFHELHVENPGLYLFLDKAAESLVNLGRYEQAIQLVGEATEMPHYPDQARIRLGEIYHTEGDTSAAFEVWDQLLEENEDDFQLRFSVARAMNNRREFGRAIEVYEQIRERFSPSLLISSELANTYMQAGQYENAINEFLNLATEEPGRIGVIQNTLIRFNDEYLYDIAILEIDEFLGELPVSHPSHQSIHQLQIWLLVERNLYQRAVATARNYELSQSRVTYSLYGLASRLRSAREYELAEEAYRYYIDNNILSAKYRSMEELSELYIEWADWLSEYSLAYANQIDSLYQQAFDILVRLQEESPSYDQIGTVLTQQAELAIDYLHDVNLAREYLEELGTPGLLANTAQRAYIEGRIELYEGNYPRARIAFTRSNREENSGDLAEKTRYYLSLTDFYSGDYEFARIQLNALERQNTSYLANDALQLRIWIQQGINADSTGSLLDPFARGVEFFNRGDAEAALEVLMPILSGQLYHPMKDDALLVLSRNVTPTLTKLTYQALTDYLSRQGRSSALRERLLWEKARIADQVITRNFDIAAGTETGLAAVIFADNDFISEIEMPSTIEELRTLYEDILQEYPDGFYASYIRERIMELSNLQT